ncbi:MAG: hypothetical protein WC728_07805 [Elusimicrobiota bacterium]
MRFKRAVAAVDVVLCVPLILAGPQMFPDTPSYVANSILRPPLYPLLLDLLGSLALVCAFQVVLCAAAAAWLTFTLKDRLGLPPVLAWLCHALLLSPLLPFPLITGSIGNAVLSEALAYALFLAAAAFLVRHATGARPWDAPVFIGLCGLLTLVRSQFVFLAPAALVVLVQSWSSAAGGSRRRGLALAAAAAVLAPPMLNYGYHRIVNRASPPGQAGLYLLSYMLYAGEGLETRVRLDPEQAALLNEARAAMDAGKLGAWYRYEANASLANYLDGNYNRICWGVAAAVIDRRAGGLSPTEQAAARGRIAADLAWPLLRAAPGAYLKLVAALVLAKMPFYLGLFLAFVLAYCAALFVRDRDGAAFAAGSFTLMHFSNVLLVGAFQPLLHRYIFYTEILQVVALVALVHHLRPVRARAHAKP